MKPLILIPARYASTRFPGKPLALIGDKPVIWHVVEKARNVSHNVYVATDDERIASEVERRGGAFVMTSPNHKSGTDRCYEAYTKLTEMIGSDFDVVVNIQGDEPFIDPSQIRSLISCFENSSVDIATLAIPFEKNEDIFNPNKVKVVVSAKETALYFSRCPIPYCRGVEEEFWLKTTPHYKHVGMYAYRPSVLKAICALPQSSLEKAESLEQLRWLENGFKIAVRMTSHESIGIDTPEDLEAANKFFNFTLLKEIK